MTSVVRTAGAPGWLRRHRAALLVAGATLLAVALSVLTSGRAAYSDPLDPGNSDPGGARAVARVLDDQGVRVQVVRDAAALDHAGIDADTTVVVTSLGNLGRSTADRLLSDASPAALVLVDPPVGSLQLFGLPEGSRVRRPGTVTAGCNDPRYDGLEVRVDRATAYPGGLGCFRVHGNALLSTDPARAVTVLGAGGLLSNDQVLRADNAAVALTLLGEHARLVWYVPDPADLVADDAVGLGSILPRWLGPGVGLVVLSAVALALWRGRRLGPLVTEPLPVTVTAIESTESRGRLYRKVRDRAHAAGVLRRAAGVRIAVHLRLPRGATADSETLVREIAAASGLPPQRVRDLLSPEAPVPGNDRDLTHLGHDLAGLDREVRRP